MCSFTAHLIGEADGYTRYVAKWNGQALGGMPSKEVIPETEDSSQGMHQQPGRAEHPRIVNARKGQITKLCTQVLLFVPQSPYKICMSNVRGSPVGCRVLTRSVRGRSFSSSLAGTSLARVAPAWVHGAGTRTIQRHVASHHVMTPRMCLPHACTRSLVVHTPMFGRERCSSSTVCRTAVHTSEPCQECMGVEATFCKPKCPTGQQDLATSTHTTSDNTITATFSMHGLCSHMAFLYGTKFGMWQAA